MHKFSLANANSFIKMEILFRVNALLPDQFFFSG